jgi:hypothetical protein
MISNRVLRIVRCVLAGAALIFSVAQAKEEKTYIAPPPMPAHSYVSHEEDSQNKVTVAVDPYDSPARATIFSVEYLKFGLLPVYLIVSNDGDQAISMRDLRAELVTGRKAKLEALSTEEVMRRLFQHGEIQPRVSGPSPNPLPIPLPHKSRNAQQEKAQSEVERARFSYIAVEPHTTRAGFLFFDSGAVHDATTNSYVYVSGVRNGQGQELLYFELPLQPAPRLASTQ